MQARCAVQVSSADGSLISMKVKLRLFRDVGNKIESVVKPRGFSIVRQYTGHGTDQRVSSLPYRVISRRSVLTIVSLAQFHGKPLIAHYGGSKTPGKMEIGHCFTIGKAFSAIIGGSLYSF